MGLSASIIDSILAAANLLSLTLVLASKQKSCLFSFSLLYPTLLSLIFQFSHTLWSASMSERRLYGGSCKKPNDTKITSFCVSKRANGCQKNPRDYLEMSSHKYVHTRVRARAQKMRNTLLYVTFYMQTFVRACLFVFVIFHLTD